MYDGMEGGAPMNVVHGAMILIQDKSMSFIKRMKNVCG
jgi:hypothetical protein